MQTDKALAVLELRADSRETVGQGVRGADGYSLTDQAEVFGFHYRWVRRRHTDTVIRRLPLTTLEMLGTKRVTL